MTLHETVFTALLTDIQSGKYQTGQKLPSEAALGKRFKTSRITIGRALRELKQKGLVHGVAGAGNFVTPSIRSADLLFGLLIPNLGETEIFEPICQGIASAPEAGKYALVWGQTAEEASLERQALQLCRQYIDQKLTGVFFAPLEMTPNSAEVNLEISALFEKAAIPVVLLDRCILPFPQRSRHDLVGIDNRRAGYLATEHLLRVGRRRVGFLARAGGAPTIEARISGYREALLLHGIEFQTNRVQRLESISSSLVREAIEAANADAFVCANDRTAGQFLHALQELGVEVPRDLSVVGIDDVDYGRLLPVPLTTVHQPCRDIGHAAITAMLSRRERPGMIARDVLLDCRLVIRKSSGVSAG